MTDPTMTERDEDEAIAAEYALGLLTRDEARAFEDRLSVDPDFRAVYAFWAEQIVRLTDVIPAVAPPAALRRSIEDRLFPRARRSLLQRLGVVPALLGGLAAAALLLFVTDLGVLRPVDPELQPTHSAQVASDDGSLIVFATFDPEAGALSIDRTTGAARTGRALELWVIAGDNPPISLGVLPEDRAAVIAVPQALQAAVQTGVLAISDEPVGGSLTGAPTGDVLAVGEVVEL